MILLQQVESNRTPITSIDRTTIDPECYYCHVLVHLSNNCPKLPVGRRSNRGEVGRGSVGRTGTVMCQICVGLAQHDDGIIPSTWFFLDTCSTISFGNNPYMFKNIW